MMEHGVYYRIKQEDLRSTLNLLEKLGFLWRENLGGSQMSSYFDQALSLNIIDPVLEVEEIGRAHV